MNKALNILSIFFVGYLFSLPTSMGGMELFSWFSVIVFLPLLAFQSTGLLQNIKDWNFKPVLFAVPFVVIVMIGALVNDLTPENRNYILGEMRWIVLLLVFPIIIHRNWELFKKSLPYWLPLLGLLAIYSIIQVFTGIDIVRSTKYEANSLTTLWRAKGFFSMTMTYSYTFSMFFMFLFASLLTGAVPEKMRRYMLFVLVLVGISLILTFTRGAWLAIIISTLVLTSLFDRKKMIFLLGSIFVAMLGFSAALPEFRSRIFSILDVNNFSNVGRFKLWAANWHMFLDNFWTGVGYRQSHEHLEKYYEFLQIEGGLISHSHNNYLSMLSCLGIFGLLTYLLFIGAFFYLAVFLWKRREQLTAFEQTLVLGTLGAYICFHIGGLTENTYADGEVFHAYLFVSSLLLVVFNRWLSKEKMRSLNV